MTTARKVAELAGVSVSTVGRALSDDPRISADTSARVHRIATQLGYIVNQAAKVMRGGPSTVVGVVVPDISNGFYATIAHALSGVLRSNGFQLMLGETGDERTVELQQVRSFAAYQVAGVIVVPTARPHPETVRLLNAVPHVQLLRRSPRLAPQWFGIDDRHGLRMATEHLLALGHRRIGLIGASENLLTGAERRKGYTAALLAAGLPVSDELVYLGPPSSVRHGADAVAGLLDRDEPPTALLTASIPATRGALEELSRRRVRVPNDLAVVGFGDEAGWSYWGPGLTTLSLPTHQVATSCAQWLVSRLTSGNPQFEQPYTCTSQASLIIRRSTAAPANRPAERTNRRAG